jgi:Flp pilus assembly protein TadG
VELAILTPAILLALFASIQLAAWFMARSVALTAAQEATTAQRAFDAAGGAGSQRASTFLAGSGDWLTDPEVRVDEANDQITSTVTGRALSIVPGVHLAVSQTAHGERERFTTEDVP